MIDLRFPVGRFDMKTEITLLTTGRGSSIRSHKPRRAFERPSKGCRPRRSTRHTATAAGPSGKSCITCPTAILIATFVSSSP